MEGQYGALKSGAGEARLNTQGEFLELDLKLLLAACHNKPGTAARGKPNASTVCIICLLHLHQLERLWCMSIVANWV